MSTEDTLTYVSMLYRTTFTDGRQEKTLVNRQASTNLEEHLKQLLFLYQQHADLYARRTLIGEDITFRIETAIIEGLDAPGFEKQKRS